MLQNELELMIAQAINRASGSYLTPTFKGEDQPNFSGNYYSIHSHTTAGYYDSTQTWSGNNGVIMTGDRITGSTGRNNLGGGNGNDVIYSPWGDYLNARGGAGNDTIIGPDLLGALGGEGNDFIAAGVDIRANSSGNYLLSWQKALATADSMTPDVLHSYFTYANGNNRLYGGSGSDVILAPGDGNNLVYGDDTSETSTDGNDLVIVGNGENTVYGGGGNDTVYAGSGINKIYGESGDDYIYAEGSQSILDGGNGNDIIIATGHNNNISGGAGDDAIYITGLDNTINGGDGFDLVSFAQMSSGGVTLSTSFWNKVTNVEGVVGSAFADQITGTAKDDYMAGGGGNDELHGGAGNDSLLGDAGNDMLYGGAGNDFYFLNGQFGNDQVFENAGEGTDDRIVFNNLTINDVVYGRLGNDLMFGDASQTNTVAVKDWFLNFGVDSFWFTTGTANQYNYVTAEAVAAAFGVTIPGTAANDASLLADNAALDSTGDFVSGDSLAPVAVQVAGVDMTPEGMPALC